MSCFIFNDYKLKVCFSADFFCWRKVTIILIINGFQCVFILPVKRLIYEQQRKQMPEIIPAVLRLKKFKARPLKYNCCYKNEYSIGRIEPLQSSFIFSEADLTIENLQPDFFISRSFFNKNNLILITIYKNENKLWRSIMVVIRRRTIITALLAIAFCLALFFMIKGKVVEASGAIREIPIYSVENSNGNVSITFDCAWGAHDIPEILGILKEKNVKATFFVVGEWARRNPEETRMIAEQGHDLANHSENHFKMSVLSRDKIKTEILDCTKTIEDIAGVKTDLFRAPYGDYNDTVLSIARQNGYYTIQWSLDSLDWKPGMTEEAILNRISKVSSGDILLFHNDTSHTVKILGKVIDIIREKNLNPVPVSELILRENFEIQHDGRQMPKN